MKTTYKGLQITGKLHKTGVRFPFEKDGKPYHNHFKITVKSKSAKITFDFYGSEMSYRNGIQEMSEDELLTSFYFFVSDAISGLNTFEDFYNESGYDIDYRRAEKIHKDCVKSHEKFSKLQLEEDIYEFANELQEIAG